MVERSTPQPLREHVMIPTPDEPCAPASDVVDPLITPPIPVEPIIQEMEQEQLPMPPEQTWRMVGELYNSYIIVEEGDNAFLIDKHAAHERILFDKLKANQEVISSQALLSPIPVRLSAEGAAELLSNRPLLEELGFEVDEFGENTVLLRQIPMDLSPDDAAEAAEALAADLLNGRHDTADTVRDEVLHTVACKAAIKAGWHTDEAELLALVKQVMAREDLKYCPHGRPICITLSQKQLEKQFKRA
jgi:DNA mismatch repair protein MutL